MGQEAQNRSCDWTGTQAYVLAVICLLFGILIGYVLRGSGPARTSPTATAAAAGPPTESAPGAVGPQVTPQQLKAMADKRAEPVLGLLKLHPNDPALLAQAGNIYYDAQQFQEATGYYARALESDPRNTDVRTDMATGYWYLGDVNRALTEFDRVLKQEPNKANALLNRGIVRWQGRMDVKGAVADWESLLKADPNFPQRSKVEQLIAEAKKHSNIKPGEKSPKTAM